MKPNYNYKYIAVSHSDHTIWGLGTTAEEALRDAMGSMHDNAPDADEYTDWELFRRSREYDDLDVYGITEAALTTAGVPHGGITAWLRSHVRDVVVIKSIVTMAEFEEYYAGADKQN